MAKKEAKERYTLPFGGREVYLDGEHVFSVARKGFSPSETDAIGHFIVELLNAADEDGDTFEVFVEEYMRS